MRFPIVARVAIIVVVVVASSIVLFEIGNNNAYYSMNDNSKRPINPDTGLVINMPENAVTLEHLQQTYVDATSSQIGRTNLYVFWNILEPQRGEFAWSEYDSLMKMNRQNDLRVTLFFSVINGESMGPFPKWLDEQSNHNSEKRFGPVPYDGLVSVLDTVLSRYDSIDTVIIAGETESYFRYQEDHIYEYNDLFKHVSDKIKQMHPDIKIGNSFALHNIINKNLDGIFEKVALGDYVAFSYMPVDSLNEITKTPEDAILDLQMGINLVNVMYGGDDDDNDDDDKNSVHLFNDALNSTVPGNFTTDRIGLFEVGWATSAHVGGSEESQREFVSRLYDFYAENDSEIAFVTWYRMHDKQPGTCASVTQNIGQTQIDAIGSALGTSEFVVERLDRYMCSSGLISLDGDLKPGGVEFAQSIDSILSEQK